MLSGAVDDEKTDGIGKGTDGGIRQEQKAEINNMKLIETGELWWEVDGREFCGDWDK